MEDPPVQPRPNGASRRAPAASHDVRYGAKPGTPSCSGLLPITSVRRVQSPPGPGGRPGCRGEVVETARTGVTPSGWHPVLAGQAPRPSCPPLPELRTDRTHAHASPRRRRATADPRALGADLVQLDRALTGHASVAHANRAARGSSRCRAAHGGRRAARPARGPLCTRTIRQARTALRWFPAATATARGRSAPPASSAGSGPRPGSHQGTCLPSLSSSYMSAPCSRSRVDNVCHYRLHRGLSSHAHSGRHGLRCGFVCLDFPANERQLPRSGLAQPGCQGGDCAFHPGGFVRPVGRQDERDSDGRRWGARATSACPGSGRHRRGSPSAGLASPGEDDPFPQVVPDRDRGGEPG